MLATKLEIYFMIYTEKIMSTFDYITEGLKYLLEAAKDLPTEKIAAVGLILLGTGAIIKDLAQGNPSEALEKAKSIIDMQ